MNKLRYFHRGTLRAGVASPHPEIKKNIRSLLLKIEENRFFRPSLLFVHFVDLRVGREAADLS